MYRCVGRLPIIACLLACVCACGEFIDPATRLAGAIEHAAGQLAAEEGARYTIRYEPPDRLRRDGDSYTVQLDKVGALIVWYKDANGAVIDSGNTSYHSRFVDTPRTYIVDKPGDAALEITILREHGRAVVADVK